MRAFQLSDHFINFKFQIIYYPKNWGPSTEKTFNINICLEVFISNFLRQFELNLGEINIPGNNGVWERKECMLCGGMGRGPKARERTIPISI
jgi:hypothetical protein